MVSALTRAAANDGGDLRGKVGIVVDQGDAAVVPAHVEPAGRRRRTGRALPRRCERDADARLIATIEVAFLTL